MLCEWQRPSILWLTLQVPATGNTGPSHSQTSGNLWVTGTWILGKSPGDSQRPHKQEAGSEIEAQVQPGTVTRAAGALSGVRDIGPPPTF